jgi:hypothetical protein
MARKKNTLELLVKSLDPTCWRNIPAGFRIYPLWTHPETGASISLFECPKGVGVPVRHTHASNQFMYCLKGRYEYTSTGLTLEAGSFYMNPKDHPHGPTMAHEDSLLIEMYDGPHYYERPVYHSDKTVGSVAGGASGKRGAAKPASKKAAAKTAVKQAATKKKAAKKVATRKAVAKKPAARKVAVKKVAAKKAPAKKVAAKKAPARKAPARKSARR